MIQNTKNTVISADTIVEPTGVSAKIEIIMPEKAQSRDIITEQIITLRKLLKTLIAESAGKIMRADISRDPTKFIAMTIITAITTAMSRNMRFSSSPPMVPSSAGLPSTWISAIPG